MNNTNPRRGKTALLFRTRKSKGEATDFEKPKSGQGFFKDVIQGLTEPFTGSSGDAHRTSTSPYYQQAGHYHNCHLPLPPSYSNFPLPYWPPQQNPPKTVEQQALEKATKLDQLNFDNFISNITALLNNKESSASDQLNCYKKIIDQALQPANQITIDAEDHAESSNKITKISEIEAQPLTPYQINTLCELYAKI